MRNVWRASELAISRDTTRPTGHATLDAELPGAGWPRSVLVELLVQQHGIGEMQLLKPALAALSARQRVALIQPPFLPNSMTCRAWRVDERSVYWVRPASSADALWAAEQMLKSGAFGAVVLWQSNVRPEALRRLNLAAQGTETWLWLVRPLAAASDPSPSPLRLALRPAFGGVSVDIIKRKGPHCEHPVFVTLNEIPAGRQPDNDHEAPAQRVFATAAARSAVPALV
ncbi:translesion DNA synthesis-associated protein ImuA [Duganella sp. BuS-21]